MYWCLEVINTKNSVNSCKGKNELFKCMFGDGVLETFSVSPAKASYLITEALGPYFKNQLLAELQDDDVYITLQFDESGNVQSKKELQIRTIFWSNVDNCVVNRYLGTYFIEKGDGHTILKYLIKALDDNGLKINKTLFLAMDGPNVNKKVFRLYQKIFFHKFLFLIKLYTYYSTHFLIIFES